MRGWKSNMLNRIILIGRLVRDPELRYTSSGKAFCYFTLAVERNYTNRNGDRDVDFIKCITWSKQAENSAKYLKKGRLAAVDGRLQINKNKSKKNGKTYINPEVAANQVQFLDWSKEEGRNNNNEDSYGPPDDWTGDNEEDFDVPF